MNFYEYLFVVLSLPLIIFLILLLFSNWRLWKKADLTILKAKIFLDESFMKNNFLMFSIMGIIIGLSIGFHIIIEMIELIDMEIPDGIYPVVKLLYYVGLIISFICLSVMGVFWRNILQKENKINTIYRQLVSSEASCL
ncbi:MAG: hypothetical protein M8353_07945 [ANME-2 cluster archaeon]|nr:hypothetical protein [ANME-2 cluster archaeon]